MEGLLHGYWGDKSGLTEDLAEVVNQRQRSCGGGLAVGSLTCSHQRRDLKDAGITVERDNGPFLGGRCQAREAVSRAISWL